MKSKRQYLVLCRLYSSWWYHIKIITIANLQIQVVTVAYYNIRLVLTLTISLLTAKTVLMTLFILRFDTMTGVQYQVSRFQYPVNSIRYNSSVQYSFSSFKLTQCNVKYQTSVFHCTVSRSQVSGMYQALSIEGSLSSIPSCTVGIQCS